MRAYVFVCSICFDRIRCRAAHFFKTPSILSFSLHSFVHGHCTVRTSVYFPNTFFAPTRSSLLIKSESTTAAVDAPTSEGEVLEKEEGADSDGAVIGNDKVEVSAEALLQFFKEMLIKQAVDCQEKLIGVEEVNAVLSESKIRKQLSEFEFSSSNKKVVEKQKWLAVVFIMKTFNAASEREGSEKDELNIQYMLHNAFGLDMTNRDIREDVIKKNKTAGEVKLKLRKIAKRSKETTFDYTHMLLIFSTHGKQGKIMGSDDVFLDIEEICDILQTDKLVKIPKLICIQACQGEMPNRGITTDVNPQEESKQGYTGGSQTAIQVEAEGGLSLPPRDVNFLVCHSTSPRYMATRDEDYGSVFINVLIWFLLQCEEEETKSSDAFRFLTRVNACFRDLDFKTESEDEIIKQMPLFTSTLTKPLQIRVQKVENPQNRDEPKFGHLQHSPEKQFSHLGELFDLKKIND